MQWTLNYTLMFDSREYQVRIGHSSSLSNIVLLITLYFVYVSCDCDWNSTKHQMRCNSNADTILEKHLLWDILVREIGFTFCWFYYDWSDSVRNTNWLASLGFYFKSSRWHGHYWEGMSVFLRFISISKILIKPCLSCFRNISPFRNPVKEVSRSIHIWWASYLKLLLQMSSAPEEKRRKTYMW